ncbi:MAG: type III secretion system export apparatus subunit SctR [Betaproteobacteria bacterium]|jgi:type III secretion protein R|nr:type III secretion system export apparatus subunit SctR [Betaproteobacteria bacterium]
MDLTSFTPATALITVVVLSLAPFVAVMVTSFTKIVVVLSLLRTALGLQQTPPNVVINGMALVLTLYVMYPVMLDVADRWKSSGQTATSAARDTDRMLGAIDAVKEPLRTFLIKHSAPRERAFFQKTAQRMVGEQRADQVGENDFIVVIPAFTVSELVSAFQIGFLIFLPFLVIDLVVSNILLAMGMMMLSPVTVSLPFKLLLFVLIDGWVKLSHGLVLSYH